VLFVFLSQDSNPLFIFTKLLIIIKLHHPTQKLVMAQLLCHPLKRQGRYLTIQNGAMKVSFFMKIQLIIDCNTNFRTLFLIFFYLQYFSINDIRHYKAGISLHGKESIMQIDCNLIRCKTTLIAEGKLYKLIILVLQNINLWQKSTTV